MSNHEPLELVLRAVSFAARRHAGQFRKDGRTPYAAHPARVMTVAALVFKIEDHETLAAAALHDTIEDTTCDHDELAEEFGPRVADMVAALSKDKRLREEERERAYFATLAAAPVEVRLCKLADVYDNLLDSRNQPAAARAKTIARAHEVLGLLEPTLPDAWRHAAAAVRAVLQEAERSV